MALISDHGGKVFYESSSLIKRVVEDAKTHPPATQVYVVVWDFMGARFVTDYNFDELPQLTTGKYAFITSLGQLYYLLKQQDIAYLD